MGKVINLEGQRFGRLVALCHVPPKSWLCRCDCGVEKAVQSYLLRIGDTRSCGCLVRDTNTKWAAHLKPTLSSWKAMKNRCLRPSAKHYHNYGGRGITVCERWLSFENFLADMGERPDDMTLDRIEVNGHYEPGNCRWASRADQVANVRPRERGIKLTAAQAREIYASTKRTGILAARYGVGSQNIVKIKAGLIWKSALLDRAISGGEK